MRTFDTPRTKALAAFIAKEGPTGTGRVTGLSIEPDGVFIYTTSALWCDDAGAGTFRADSETAAIRTFYDRVRAAPLPEAGQLTADHLTHDRIDGATQYSTVRGPDGRPMATLQRKRVMESGPAWRMFDTAGIEIGNGYDFPHRALRDLVRISNELAAPAPQPAAVPTSATEAHKVARQAFNSGATVGQASALSGLPMGEVRGLFTEWHKAPAPQPAEPAPAPIAESHTEDLGPFVDEPAPAPVAEVRKVDITPTWAAVLPVLLLGYEQGNATGRAIARDELGRMADLADRYVAAEKESNAAAKAARERFESDLAAAPQPGDFPDVAALLGPRTHGNPADVFNMTEAEARAVVWAWGRLVPGLVATPATEEPGGPHEAHMGYGLTVAGSPGAWLWISRAAVAHAVALAKSVPPIAQPDPGRAWGERSGRLIDLNACLRNGHALGNDGRCTVCGMAL
jgi:hypothetical protein